MTPTSTTQQQWSPEEKLCYSLLTHTAPKPKPKPKPSLSSLLQIQAFLLRRSLLFSNLHLLTSLISSLSFTLALRLFQLRTSQDSFLCNSLFRALSRQRRCSIQALALYRDLRRSSSFSPDSFTFPFLLKSCGALHSAALQLHPHVIKMGFCGDPFTSTALVDIYSKGGNVRAARKLFDEMPQRNVVSWTSVIVGHARAGDLGSAVELFRHMPEKDTAAENAMIDVFLKFGDFDSARKVFDGMRERNVVTWTSLLSGYATAGYMEAAKALFDEMPVKNLFTWNAMIGGYCKNNQPNRALELFHKLQLGNYLFRPDEVTLISIIPAISSTGMIDLARWIHRYAQTNKLDKHVNVATTLVDMYLKCGDIEEARQTFNSIPNKEIASWNAMINGLALNGRAFEALNEFSTMTETGSRPNEVTMLSVLSACAHGGLIDKGLKLFHAMDDFGIERGIEHYGCMVDLLGRGGRLDEAERLVKEMPYEPNGVILSSLLSACVSFKDVRRAERVMSMAERVEPGNVRNYLLMRNLYAEERRWGDVERVKEVIRGYGGKKEAGVSVVEDGRRVWEFVSGDRAHPEWGEFYEILRGLQLQMRGGEEEGEWRFEAVGMV